MKIWLVFILSIFALSARSTDRDSLMAFMEGLPENEQKIDALHQLWKAYANDSIEKAMNYAEKERELALVLENDKWLAKSYFSIGYLSQRQGYLGKAVANYVHSIELLKKLKDYSQLSSAYYNLANLFLIAEDYVNAKLYYEEALKLRLKGPQSKPLSGVYHGIGEACVGLDMYEEALVAYEKALKEAMKEDNLYAINELYNTIGILYQSRKMFDLARENFYKSIEIDSDEKMDIAIAYNNIGETYLEQNKIDLARDFFDKSLVIKESLNVDYSRVITLMNLGKSYLAVENYSKAKEYLNRAIDLADTEAIDRGAIETLNILNDIHNIEAAEGIYPKGQEMLKYENIQTRQMALINSLNSELSPLKNRYLLQVNYEVPMLSSKLSSAIDSKKVNSKLAIIATILALITIVFMTYYMRKVVMARKMLSKF